MGTIGYGYGSEWQLLWHLARHREAFNSSVLSLTGGTRLEWLDFPRASRVDRTEDREWVGLGFLEPDDPVRRSWESKWPQTGTAQNWDAVGRVIHADQPEWILVEAKAHTGELISNCGAGTRSRERIVGVLNTTKAALGVDAGIDWTKGYYQYANRLAVLHHLIDAGVRAHLLFIYFTGDRTDIGGSGRNCPRTREEWDLSQTALATALGLPAIHGLQRNIHSMFLPAWHVQVGKTSGN